MYYKLSIEIHTYLFYVYFLSTLRKAFSVPENALFLKKSL
jgi:hypothetical protein